ncbi:hypothetical protein CMT41_14790 [Colwellia sp. MT41]|uniref:DUF3718 domain-containing protein n=1 Tax=Colwellia marinimaniae TaxID=1513592 RepID=A0ABQ0MQM5_9GAMM|nr:MULTISPECIES: DUF3718 domain-containing protein [Colwellia]ALO35846.1 hypothetical protein CMT41_14790 [Colwellia sp. MT41]GAW94671.1 hypothetical protein MTCD1_00268 [Colwellia marinimaniae]
MTTIKKTLVALAAALPLLAISLPSQAAMSPYMEKALIDVCKAAKSNSIIKLKGTTKGYRLQTKTVALKLMCNGQDVISFAESYGADKTAARLQRSIGNVSITDVAALSKVKVTF